MIAYAIWVATPVAVAVTTDDLPGLAFAIGGGVFVALLLGLTWLQTRPQAVAGRGDTDVWSGAEAEAGSGRVIVRRPKRNGQSWLWDLWLAERLARR